MQATLTFTSYLMAKDFATAWGRFSRKGHSLSAKNKDGGATLTLYGIEEKHKNWIDNTVKEFEFAANLPVD